MSHSGNRIGIVLMLALSMCLVAFSFYANSWKGERRVERVVVEGTRIIDAEELVALAAVPLHTRLFEIDLYAIERRVAGHRYVKAVAVHRDIPNRIRITVQERKPVAVLAQGNLLYIDAEGYVLPPIRSPLVFDLPVLSVAMKPQECVPGKRTTNRSVLLALELLSLAREIDHSLYSNVSELGGDSANGYVMHTAEWGVPVLLGSNRFGEKLVTFSVFWKTVVARQDADKIEYIDVRFADQVVVRWSRHTMDVPSS